MLHISHLQTFSFIYPFTSSFCLSLHSILQEYDVSPQEAHSDVKELLSQLEKQGVIILEP